MTYIHFNLTLVTTICLILTRMHSSRMRTARSLTVSHRKNHACPPRANTHAPPVQPCTPSPSNHAHPPRATTHAPREQPHTPPQSNHACPPGATTHAPPRATTHAPPEQPRMPPLEQPCMPPLEQPCMPPSGSNHAHPLPPWTDRHL